MSRDLRAEQDHAEFTGWMEAQGYSDNGELFTHGDMADAFAAGMEVERTGMSATEYWATSRPEGDEPGQWSWPPRA